MKLLIAVMSKGRSDTIGKHTLSWLKYSKHEYKVFVEPQDYEAYSKVVDVTNLVEIPKNDMGAWYAKKMMREYAELVGFDLIFKIDDDVQNWRDPNNRGLGHSAPKVSKKERCERLFDPIIVNSLKAFKTIDGLGGIALKYGNEMRDYNPDVVFDYLNSRFQSCYITRTENFVYLEGDKNGFEDFHNYLHVLWTKGQSTLRYQLTGFDPVPVGTNEGGYQSFDRREANNISQKLMNDEFGDKMSWKDVDKTWDVEPDFRKMKKHIDSAKVEITQEDF